MGKEQLYKRIELPTDEPVQFVGKYVTSDSSEMTTGFVEYEDPEGDVTITLRRTSWNNICDSIRQSDIKTLGNFWTAIQIIEQQLEE